MNTEMHIDEECVKAAKKLTDGIFPVPNADVELLASIMERCTAQKGEVIIKEGQIAGNMIYIWEGLARQFYFKNGHDVTEHFTSEGYLLYCIESLFTQTPTHLMAEALEPLVYFKIPYQKLVELSLKSTGLCKWLIKWFETDAICSQHKADTLRFESVNERYERFLREYPQAAQRASGQHIASYLIMTRESLSRVRAGKM